MPELPRIEPSLINLPITLVEAQPSRRRFRIEAEGEQNESKRLTPAEMRRTVGVLAIMQAELGPGTHDFEELHTIIDSPTHQDMRKQQGTNPELDDTTLVDRIYEAKGVLPHIITTNERPGVQFTHVSLDEVALAWELAPANAAPRSQTNEQSPIPEGPNYETALRQLQEQDREKIRMTDFTHAVISVEGVRSLLVLDTPIAALTARVFMEMQKIPPNGKRHVNPRMLGAHVWQNMTADERLAFGGSAARAVNSSSVPISPHLENILTKLFPQQGVVKHNVGRTYLLERRVTVELTDKPDEDVKSIIRPIVARVRSSTAEFDSPTGAIATPDLLKVIDSGIDRVPHDTAISLLSMVMYESERRKLERLLEAQGRLSDFALIDERARTIARRSLGYSYEFALAERTMGRSRGRVGRIEQVGGRLPSKTEWFWGDLSERKAADAIHRDPSISSRFVIK